MNTSTSISEQEEEDHLDDDDDEDDDRQSMLFDSAGESDLLISGQAIHTLSQGEKRRLTLVTDDDDDEDVFAGERVASGCGWSGCANLCNRWTRFCRRYRVWSITKAILYKVYTLINNHLFPVYAGAIYCPLKAAFVYKWTPGFWSSDGYERVSLLALYFGTLGFKLYLWDTFGVLVYRLYCAVRRFVVARRGRVQMHSTDGDSATSPLLSHTEHTDDNLNVEQHPILVGVSAPMPVRATNRNRSSFQRRGQYQLQHPTPTSRAAAANGAKPSIIISYSSSASNP